MASLSEQAPLQPGPIAARFNAWLCGVLGYLVLAACAAGALSLLTWQIADPSLTHATSGPVRNALGPVGAIIADLIMQLLGLAGVFIVLPPIFWALQLIGRGRLERVRTKLLLAPAAVLLLACAAASLPKVATWPLPHNIGGVMGDLLLGALTSVLATIRPERASTAAGLFCFAGGMMLLMTSLGLSQRDLKLICQRPRGVNLQFVYRAWKRLGEMSEHTIIIRREPTLAAPARFAATAPPYRAPAFVPAAPRSYPPAAQFRPEPRSEPEPEPRTFEPRTIEPTSDNELDRKKLDRILSICAPKGAGKSAGTGEPPAVLLQPEPAETPRYHAPVAPARATRGFVEDPREEFHSADADHGPDQEQRPTWPDTAPTAPRRAPMVPPENGWRPQSLPGGDDLYGRAVAIVLDDRKASAGYLQQRLQIGYMRATDLIERMEREGILGAPVYNGMRPILIGGPGSREI